MSLSFFVTNFIAALLLPPLNGLLLVGVGWALLRRRPRLGRFLVGGGLLLLVVLAMPVVGNTMRYMLEGEPIRSEQLASAQAIIVLGGGRYRNAPEYGEDTVGSATLTRLRYAAKLHKETRLPLLVTGGTPDGPGLSEGEVMRRVLTNELGVPVRWVEGASDNTRENAQLSAAILKSEGISHAVLVTHALHMPRALRAFAAAGIVATPAPTIFHNNRTISLLGFVPSGYGASHGAMHEWIGILWYRIRD